MTSRFAWATAAAFLSLTTASAQAATAIDFESVPGGTAADKVAISNQYESDFGVTFSIASGGTPFLEAVGGADSGTGFQNDVVGLPDTASPGFESQLKNYFLRIGTNELQSAPVAQLVISYTTPVAAASAQIWDIDGGGPANTEQWKVEALNSQGAIIDTLLSPIGNTANAASLNGKPWTWSFDHGSVGDIASIKLSFVGTKQGGIGLAFDNFSPSSPAAAVPEPDALALELAGGLTVLSWIALRRKQQPDC